MLARRAIEREAAAVGLTEADLFLASCSARTIVYKGFCLPEDLARFYPDLQRPDVTTAIALFHQRYSTNTFPTWGSPSRSARSPTTARSTRSRATASGCRRARPACSSRTAPRAPGSNWSYRWPAAICSLDNAIELIRHSGRSFAHALMMAVPEPWEQLPDMDPDRRAFYDFHALLEQWDGPAALDSATASLPA